MQYEVDKDKDGNGEPTLTEMVQKAIQLLSRSSSANGYFLLVEGLYLPPRKRAMFIPPSYK